MCIRDSLWDADKPVAYGVYMLRHGSLVLNAWEYAGPNALGESYSLQTRRYPRIVPEGIVRVSGIGFGCTLIRREVMERLQIHGGGGQGAEVHGQVGMAGIPQQPEYRALYGKRAGAVSAHSRGLSGGTVGCSAPVSYTHLTLPTSDLV